MHLHLGKLFGWAIVLYAVMHLLWSGFILYGIAGTALGWIVSVATLVILCTIASTSLRFDSWKDVLPYSIFWAGATAFFDLIFSVPISGWEVYSEPGVLLGYVLVAIVPALAIQFLKTRASV